MLRILVVDDEELIREGIVRKIEKLAPEAEVIGTAADVPTALELVGEHHPNVIITDICMPQTDGLQFIDQVTSLYNDIRFILISGYQEFEYAKKAIRLNVQDYLLKPINNDELKAVLQKMEQEIMEEQTRSVYVKELETRSKSYLQFLKNKYLTDMINLDGEYPVPGLLSVLHMLEITFPYRFYTVATILLPVQDNLLKAINEEEYSRMKNNVLSYSHERLLSLGKVAAFENLKRENQVVIIVNHDSIPTARIIEQFKTLLHSINNSLQINATIGIGKSTENRNHIHDSYTGSYLSAMQRLVHGENNVFHFESALKPEQTLFLPSENEKLLLLSHIKSGEIEKAYETVENIFSRMKSFKPTLSNIIHVLMDFSVLFYKIIRDFDNSWSGLPGRNPLSEEQLSRYSSLEDLEKWIKGYISSISSFLSELKKSDGKRAISGIKEYIANYYYVDINLNDLADKYFINPSYLSHLFKMETGEKFIDYLTKVRMEKSRELLANTGLKSNEVAEMVGYADSRYFISLFTKIFGMTPSKFRETLKHQ